MHASFWLTCMYFVRMHCWVGYFWISHALEAEIGHLRVFVKSGCLNSSKDRIHVWYIHLQKKTKINQMYVNTQSSHGSVMGLSNMLTNGWCFTNSTNDSRALGGTDRKFSNQRNLFEKHPAKLKALEPKALKKWCVLFTLRWFSGEALSIREFIRGFPAICVTLKKSDQRRVHGAYLPAPEISHTGVTGDAFFQKHRFFWIFLGYV